MKKTLAILIAAVMCLTVSLCVFADNEPTNIAPLATYEVHDFFHQSTVTWTYDEEFPIVYGDETGSDLTDGKHAASTAFSDTAWVGMNSNHPNAEANGQYILFKLDKTYAVGSIKVTVNNLADSGIGAPSKLIASASTDGTTFGDGVEGAYTEELVKGTIAVYEIKLNKECSFIKIDYKPGDGTAWMFTDEIEIYDGGDISAPAESSEAPAESSVAPAESSAAAESSEAPAESSAADESSKAADESSAAPAESSAAGESSAAPAESSNATADNGGDLTWLWIVIGVVAAAAIVVVIIVISKKK